MINVELKSVIDRKYVELEEKNDRMNNSQIIIDKQKQELAKTKQTKFY
jgi:hypothetical protein